MKLLAVVIAYSPSPELLKRNVQAFSENVDHILLWDNTPAPGMDKGMLEGLGCEYVSTGQNEGISKALNYAWRYAKENGYDYILTMDQDSVFEDFAEYRRTAEEILEAQDCIIGPWYFPPVPRNDETPVIEREHIITSGMIVPVKLLDAVGGYCEWFKVDGIDIELCVKARQKGYKVIQCINHRLIQQFGSSYEKKVLGHIFSGPGYGPSRLYGIMRSLVVIDRKYDDTEFIKKQIHYNIANFIPNIIFAEKRKLPKLFSLFKGLVSGYLFRIPKQDTPCI